MLSTDDRVNNSRVPKTYLKYSKTIYYFKITFFSKTILNYMANALYDRRFAQIEHEALVANAT